MKELSDQLRCLVESVEPVRRQIPESESMQPASPGGWSRKQVVGHLIDSASNNHQRFVRAALEGSLEFPGYDLAHILAHLPADALPAKCRIGSAEPVTLQFLAEDYVVHLVHHVEQML